MKSFCALLTLSLLVGVPAPARSQLFKAAGAQFSTSVSSDGKYTVLGPAVNGEISRSTLTNGRLFFSFTMIGLQPAIDHLQQNGLLEANVVVFAGVSALATIPCGITQSRWLDIGTAILGKFNTDHVFTFRTWMFTDRSTYSALTLIVRDVHGTEVTRARINITP